MAIKTIEELKAEFATGQYPNAADYSDLIDTLNSGSGGSSIESSPTPPENPESGDLWFNEADGSSYIYYVDADSEQWVELGGVAGPIGATGPTGATGATGAKGDPGEGVPVGGTAGQILRKTSSTNYATEWSTNSLNNLSNVSLSSPSSGDILEYNGTNWVKGQRATTGKAIAMSIVFG